MVYVVIYKMIKIPLKISKNINARREIHMKLAIFLLVVAAIIVGIVCLILKLIKNRGCSISDMLHKIKL